MCLLQIVWYGLMTDQFSNMTPISSQDFKTGNTLTLEVKGRLCE